MASTLVAMASNLGAMASTLAAMASNRLATGHSLLFGFQLKFVEVFHDSLGLDLRLGAYGITDFLIRTVSEDTTLGGKFGLSLYRQRARKHAESSRPTRH